MNKQEVAGQSLKEEDSQVAEYHPLLKEKIILNNSTCVSLHNCRRYKNYVGILVTESGTGLLLTPRKVENNYKKVPGEE
jgi:hypothetical protein